MTTEKLQEAITLRKRITQLEASLNYIQKTVVKGLDNSFSDMLPKDVCEDIERCIQAIIKEELEHAQAEFEEM